MPLTSVSSVSLVWKTVDQNQALRDTWGQDDEQLCPSRAEFLCTPYPQPQPPPQIPKPQGPAWDPVT